MQSKVIMDIIHLPHHGSEHTLGIYIALQESLGSFRLSSYISVPKAMSQSMY